MDFKKQVLKAEVIERPEEIPAFLPFLGTRWGNGPSRDSDPGTLDFHESALREKQHA
jgi:hypothetical protein